MSDMDTTHPDYALGYCHPLETNDVAWLASEVRMLHVKIERLRRDSIEDRARYAQRMANARHIMAHAVFDRLAFWRLGKHATTGAMRAIECLYPVAGCSPGCDGSRGGAQ